MRTAGREIQPAVLLCCIKTQVLFRCTEFALLSEDREVR